MISNLELLKETITEKLKTLNPEKIILFGSYAYGNPTDDSDLDICVIESTVSNKIKEKSKIDRLLSDLDVGKDILVPSLDEYEFYKNECGSVYREIEEKGIVLWPT